MRTSKLGDEIRSAYDEKEWSGGAMLGWADDVDALLAVVRAAQGFEVEHYPITGDTVVHASNEEAQALHKALSALPEHLK